MYIVQVHVRVKTSEVDSFKIATRENAINSISNEQGVARFDVLQQSDDPTQFILLEIYHTRDDAAKHKETVHYNRWRKIAEPMMAEPRSRIIYTNIFPDDSGYS